LHSPVYCGPVLASVFHNAGGKWKAEQDERGYCSWPKSLFLLSQCEMEVLLGGFPLSEHQKQAR
jgi:hypothetical protein